MYEQCGRQLVVCSSVVNVDIRVSSMSEMFEALCMIVWMEGDVDFVWDVFGMQLGVGGE